jgi:hypothetical protein
VAPESTTFSFDPGAFAGVADVLARPAGREDVDRRDSAPVDGRDIPEVRNTGVVVREDLAGGRVDLGVPGELAAEDLLDSPVQPPVATEE